MKLHEALLCSSVLKHTRLDFRRSLVSSASPLRGRSAGSPPEQRLVIEPRNTPDSFDNLKLVSLYIRPFPSYTLCHFLKTSLFETIHCKCVPPPPQVYFHANQTPFLQEDLFRNRSRHKVTQKLPIVFDFHFFKTRDNHWNI